MKKGTLEIKTNLGENQIQKGLDKVGYKPKGKKRRASIETPVNVSSLIKKMMLVLNAKIEVNPEEETISIK